MKPLKRVFFCFFTTSETESEREIERNQAVPDADLTLRSSAGQTARKERKKNFNKATSSSAANLLCSQLQMKTSIGASQQNELLHYLKTDLLQNQIITRNIITLNYCL